jgi:type II secretory pathway component PulJ
MCNSKLRLRRRGVERRRRQGGFTPVEVLVASAVGLTALAAVMSFNRFQMLTLRNQTTQVDVQTTSRNIVELFSREMRRAGANPGCKIAAFSGLADARTQRVRIQSDLNGDGALTAPGEDVTYRYREYRDAVERIDVGAGGTTEVLLSGIDLRDSNIRYFDGNGTELNPWSGSLTSDQRAAVRRVRIELNVAARGLGISSTGALVAQQTADVDLRNRFFLGTTACPGS